MRGLDSFSIVSLMKPAFIPLPREAGGSHSKIYFIDEQKLGAILAEAAVPGAREKARELGIRIGSRFIVKVGNIHDYIVKLKDGRESVIRRQHPSEAFGPGGYNLAPTVGKVLTDVREAARQIPFMSFGSRRQQLAPDVLGDIARCISGRPEGDSADGTFLVQDTPDGIRKMSIRQLLTEDPFFRSRIGSFEELRRYQEFLRVNPIDSATETILGDFFNSPITVGFRDTLRFLEGSRHPSLGWDRARAVILESFEKYGRETFLPPEFNYYTSSMEYSPECVLDMNRENSRAAASFAELLKERAPADTFAGMGEKEIEAVASAILEIHFDYPEFEVDPVSGVFSTATARLVARSAFWATIQAADVVLPDRRNAITDEIARRSSALAFFLDRMDEVEREDFLSLVNRILWEVAIHGGVPDNQGRIWPWKRVNRTFFSFQELAQYQMKSRGTLEETVTLEDLYRPSGRKILQAHPELPGKLLVFFVLAYRYYTETGHIPDLRPDDAGIDLFVRGTYGYSTRNVLVALGRDRDGRPDSDVRFIDNRDQFKQYRRWEDRDRPLGFVKYGLRMLSPVARPGLERAIGMYAEAAAGGPSRKTGLVDDAPQRMREVLRRGVEAVATNSRVLFEDAIDDTAKGLKKMAARTGIGESPRR